jgi:hypothetical protein
MIGNQWNSFFASDLWTQTISNIKGTWAKAPANPNAVPGMLASPPAPFK